MDRILSLQNLEPTGLEAVGQVEADSTSSLIACVCSTHSNGGCTPPPVTYEVWICWIPYEEEVVS